MSRSRSNRIYLYLGIGIGLSLFPSIRKRVIKIVGSSPKINQGLENLKESTVMSTKSILDVARKRFGISQESSRGFQHKSDEESPNYII